MVRTITQVAYGTPFFDMAFQTDSKQDQASPSMQELIPELRAKLGCQPSPHKASSEQAPGTSSQEDALRSTAFSSLQAEGEHLSLAHQ